MNQQDGKIYDVRSLGGDGHYLSLQGIADAENLHVLPLRVASFWEENSLLVRFTYHVPVLSLLL